ncbi:hypothetical protein [Lentimicrobium sp.]|jgi:DNA replication protein DnaD|uniref:hypothetical protein n=1 Tax=Lentimicrobium sp. TaxID=2034841 RepID=UPI0025EC2834|nr:hypothetical protein [Lentimicrobium sp.]MCO5257530.1 hypothetical protein [Lentimicrobium sp.]MCO5263282.1 hypothetical protein [Lentimicrobium sp.]HOP12347.1 hypothetical protein [Lentimicrobium sp.]HPJ62524.1 hypothetical protein [Lentimicrobium sp.]HRW69890.1 hypothetical protein [Lentimicrobium sp.]
MADEYRRILSGFTTNISKTGALDKKNRALDNLSASEHFSDAYLQALDDVCCYSMQDYLKEILNRVSFDKELFLKELKKHRRWLTPEECEMLDAWVLENHSEIIGDRTNHPVAG